MSLEKMLKTAAVLSTEAEARFWEVGDQERSQTSETWERSTPEYSHLREEGGDEDPGDAAGRAGR